MLSVCVCLKCVCVCCFILFFFCFRGCPRELESKDVLTQTRCGRGQGGGATRKGSWDESLQAVEILGQVDGAVFNQINTLEVSSQAGGKT